MHKRLYALLIAFAILSTGIIFYSCSKTEVSKQQSVESLQQDLYKSADYNSFVSAVNNIVASLSINSIKNADTKTASALIGNKENFSTTEMNAILSKLNVNADVYTQSLKDMYTAVKNFQAKHNLSDNENSLIWQQTIMMHKESFSKQIWFPDIQGFIDCVITSVQEFAATTAVCLALRQIPIIGEKLYEACETEAINLLISNLTGCLDYILP